MMVDLLLAIVFFVMAMVVSLVSNKFDFYLHIPYCSPRAKPHKPVEILPRLNFSIIYEHPGNLHHTIRSRGWVKNKPSSG